MGKEIDDLRRIVGEVPWLTAKGLDLAKFPTDGVLRQSLAEDEGKFHGAHRLHKTMKCSTFTPI